MVSYSVDLSKGITESFFKDLENMAGSSLRLQKRLTGITIELFQNITRHASSMQYSKLVVQKESFGYSFIAVNTVVTDDARRLKKNIRDINSLNHQQLKRQYKTILSNTLPSKKSGAGLGLYYLALRSATRLVTAFRRVDKNHFTFSLYVTLNSPS